MQLPATLKAQILDGAGRPRAPTHTLESYLRLVLLPTVGKFYFFYRFIIRTLTPTTS
jgi:hypothetical protein